MEMVVVHPAYWSKGHGTELIKWCMKLAEVDGVGQGVMAVGMGADLYPKLGYKQVDEVRLEGDKDSPKGLTIKVLLYNHGDRSEERPGCKIYSSAIA